MTQKADLLSFDNAELDCSSTTHVLKLSDDDGQLISASSTETNAYTNKLADLLSRTIQQNLHAVARHLLTSFKQKVKIIHYIYIYLRKTTHKVSVGPLN